MSLQGVHAVTVGVACVIGTVWTQLHEGSLYEYTCELRGYEYRGYEYTCELRACI